MPSVKQGRTEYHFLVFGMTRPGIELWSSDPLSNSGLPIPCRTLYSNGQFVVGIEKEAFGSSSTKVANFTI